MSYPHNNPVCLHVSHPQNDVWYSQINNKSCTLYILPVTASATGHLNNSFTTKMYSSKAVMQTLEKDNLILKAQEVKVPLKL